MRELSAESLNLSARQATARAVKAAHERLAYHARIVRDEWDASEERRMKALQQQARTPREEDTP